MDADRFQMLPHPLWLTLRRRGVLSLLTGIGLAGLLNPAASQARRHKKHKKHHRASVSPPPQSPPPPVVCPATCPVCQICNASTGGCEVRTDGNGLPGQNCEAPHVCCSGACCDDFPVCNQAGGCGGCADACPAPGCIRCFTLVDGSKRCGRFNFCSFSPTCTSSVNCPSGQACVISMTDNSTNETTQPCASVGSGSCYIIDPCA